MVDMGGGKLNFSFVFEGEVALLLRFTEVEELKVKLRLIIFFLKWALHNFFSLQGFLNCWLNDLDISFFKGELEVQIRF